MDNSDDFRFPCLFDRLVDHRPEAKDESRHQRILSIADYRSAVLRDLRWLLNAARKMDNDLIYSFSEAASSVLNYGCRDLTGMTSGHLEDYDLQEEIKQTILRFEPRIIPESLSVKALPRASNVGKIAFEISGHIWALPHPEHLYLRTEMDLETGIAELIT